MAETSFPATAGSGTNFAVFTDIYGNQRPVYVLGDNEANTMLIPVGVALNSDGGNVTTAVAASKASNTVISNQPTFLCRVLITTLGTNAMSIYDNASTNSGTVIGLVPASTAAGTILNFQFPALNGITIQGNSNNPGFTIGWVNQTFVDLS